VADSRRIRVKGGNIYVEDHDFVPPWIDHGTVLMQHGICRNGSFWSQWVPYFAKDFRIVRPDLRGHGQSSNPDADYRYSAEDLIADFVTVLDTLEIDAVHYIGESFGSVVGVLAAAAHPERFSSLSLMHVPTSFNRDATQVQSVGHSSWGAALNDLGVEEWWLQARASTGDLMGNPAADAHMARQASLTPAHVAMEIARMAEEMDLRDTLRKLTVPVQFHTSAKYSYTTSAEQQKELLELIPHASLKIHEKASGRTFFTFKDVDVVAPQVLSFIRSIG